MCFISQPGNSCRRDVIEAEEGPCSQRWNFVYGEKGAPEPPGGLWPGGRPADGWRGFLAPEARLDLAAHECLLLLSPCSTPSFLAIPKMLHPHPLPDRNLSIALGDGGPERPSIGEK